MAIGRLQVHGPRPTGSSDSVDDTVELYQRTYSTLLRSSGETRLRVLEPSHRAMGSSLHPLADSDELDLGAFLYSIRRLPAGIVRARRIAMGQDAEVCAATLGGALDDWLRLRDTWGEAFGPQLREIGERRLSLRVRMLGGTQVGYARMTRRWWAPVQARLAAQELADRPLYFVSSNTHSLSNLVTGIAREREDELIAYVEGLPESDGLRGELAALRDGRSEGSWDNFLYFIAREFIDADRLAASPAVIVNVDYPLGLAAYNILREVAVDTSALRAVYLLGKAATLNADVGDVMISSVVHDEHSGTTYWLDNAFEVEDIEPDLRFGTGLDNQRAVTVKSTFLQNRSYLDFYYREAFTVVEMEAGPYCNAVYEISDAERYPVGEAVNFSKLPVDFGVIHYASDTPYTQARTLGARGLSYYGMDSTYAASLAILRRVLRLEGALA